MNTIKPKDMLIKIKDKRIGEEGWVDVDEIIDVIKELIIEFAPKDLISTNSALNSQDKIISHRLGNEEIEDDKVDGKPIKTHTSSPDNIHQQNKELMDRDYGIVERKKGASVYGKA